MLSVCRSFHIVGSASGGCILRQLVANERMLSPGRLVERESDAGVVESLADEVTALGRDVGVFFTEDLCGSVNSAADV